MTQSTSRDLLLLAAVAFRKGAFEKAGTLFAASLSSDDAEEFLSEIDVEGNLAADLADDWGTGLAGDAPRASLSTISKEIGNAMSMVSLSADDDAASDEVNLPDVVDEDEDSDGISDDFSGDIPGQMVIPSSLSSSQHQGGGTAKKISLVMDQSSPVRVR